MNKSELEKLVRKSKQAKRGAKTEFFIEIDGETRTIKDWAKMFGLGYFTILYRYKAGKRGRELIAPPRKKLNNFL